MYNDPSQSQQVSSYPISLFFGLLCLFPVFPLISIIAGTVLLIFRKGLRTELTYSLIIMLSLYLGMVNTTKLLPGGDLWNYFNWFHNAEGKSFIDYVLWNNKEPIFWIYNFMVFKITNGNFEVLVFTLSTISYLFLFFAFSSFCEALDLGKERLILGLLILAFFPQLFSLSAHIIRQFLATSFLIYYIVQKFLYRRNLWWILVLAVFVHTTSLLFVPIIFYKGFSRKFNLKVLIVSGISAFVLLLKMDQIVTLILTKIGVSFLTNIFFRLSQESFYPLDPLPLFAYLLVVSIGFLGLTNIYRVKTYVVRNIGLIHFLNLIVIVSIFVLATRDITEISVRFSFYLYAFFPFVFVLLPIKKNSLSKGLYLLFGIFMFLFWIYRLDHGVFDFAPTSVLLINPLFYILQQSTLL